MRNGTGVLRPAPLATTHVLRLPGGLDRSGWTMDAMSFLYRVLDEYPVILAAETLAIITIAIVIAFTRKTFLPLGIRYFTAYRVKKIQILEGRIRLLDALPCK
jgi:hypothetical protein